MQTVDQLSNEELSFLVYATEREMDALLEGHKYTTKFIGVCDEVTTVLLREYKKRSLNHQMFVKKRMTIEVDEQ